MTLLKEYFRLLAALAGSDETIPGEVNESITNIASSITTVTNSIKSNPIFPNNNLGIALGGFAELIVSSKIKKEVREELEKRKELLKEVFVTHKLMVKSLMMQVDSDLKLIATIRSQYLLEKELLKPDDPSPNTWISNRKKIINKRALAVQMIERHYGYREIRDTLHVSLGFISDAYHRYQPQGVAGFKLHYWGTTGYLSSAERKAVLQWLQQKDYWTIEELVEHVEEHYGVTDQSLESYYTLLKQAGFSWKRSQQSHPNKDPEQIAAKKKRLWTCSCIGEQKLPGVKCG